MTAFNRHRAKSDGYAGQCRQCHKSCRGKQSPICTCANPACNNTFLRKDGGRKRFCSHLCSSICLQRAKERNGNWKGGTYHSKKGYWYLLMPEHPRALKSGYVKRADVVLEAKLGRPLQADEIAHHKNHVKDDDSPDNLEPITPSAHAILHGSERTRASEQRRMAAGPKSTRPVKRVQMPLPQIVADRVNATSLRAVARELGCSHVLVWQYLKANRMTIRAQGQHAKTKLPP